MGRIESFLEDTNGVLISGQAVPSLLLLDSVAIALHYYYYYCPSFLAKLFLRSYY